LEELEGSTRGKGPEGVNPKSVTGMKQDRRVSKEVNRQEGEKP
jgi:hypothetical protein